MVAKRKGEKWFIGGITNGKEKTRETELNFDFLEKGKTYTMTYFEDGINAGKQEWTIEKKPSRLKRVTKQQLKWSETADGPRCLNSLNGK
ncbi:MAG: glycoside hydrolase family 97 C-terminal domain-containing protein [Chryseolinea sp.]